MVPFEVRLSQLIKEKNKSMKQIERELGYPRNTLHNYKTGTEPSAKRVVKLAKYFGVSAEYLMGESLQDSFQNLRFEDKRKILVLCMEWLTVLEEELLSRNRDKKL